MALVYREHLDAVREDGAYLAAKWEHESRYEEDGNE